MAQKYKFSLDEDNKITQMYQDLYSYGEIANILHLSPYLIHTRCKQLNLPQRDAKKVVESSNLRKYGYKYPFQSKQVQQKVKSSVKTKYGVDNISQLQEIKDRVVKTKLEKFGEINNSKTQDWRLKHDNTCMIKFGATNNSKTDTWLKQVQQTNLQKYGYNWYSQSEEFKSRHKSTNLSKYGVHDYNQQNVKDFEQYINLKDWTKDYLKTHSIITPSVVAKHFNVRIRYSFSSDT